MSDRLEVGLGLAEFLVALQFELSKARARAETQDLGFGFDGITLEMAVSYTANQVDPSPRLWVHEAATPLAEDSVLVGHRLIIRLTPQVATSPSPPGDVPSIAFPSRALRTESR